MSDHFPHKILSFWGRMTKGNFSLITLPCRINKIVFFDPVTYGPLASMPYGGRANVYKFILYNVCNFCSLFFNIAIHVSP